MTSPKYTLASQFDTTAFEGFECSARTTTVDHAQIKRDAAKLLGGINVALAVAVKSNLHGSRIKGGDYVQLKGGSKMLMVELMKKLEEQDGYSAGIREGIATKGVGRESDKTLVSLSRIMRAFAADVTTLISLNKVSVPDDLMSIAKGTNLPAKYCFLNSPYGMNDEELEEHMEPFFAFASNFDALIKKAYDSGYIDVSKVTTSRQRSHADQFVNYLAWRGIKHVR